MAYLGIKGYGQLYTFFPGARKLGRTKEITTTVANLPVREDKDVALLRNKPVAAWGHEEEGATVKILREHRSQKFWILHPVTPTYEDLIVPNSNQRFPVAAVEACWERGE